jgi:uncharacterized protein YprB with RNaseH-like and TPR domain
MSKQPRGPKILFFDIETAPIVAHVWGLWDQNVGLNQIEKDWCVLSWSAKWQGEEKVMYLDQRKSKDVRNDKNLVQEIWRLLDTADIVVTQNGKKFDQKKLNARFIINGMKPPSAFKHIDTLQLAKKHFGFTSNKLEYMAGKLNVKYKKLTDHKFPGHELWTQCLSGNLAAWKEMERYNKHDVLALEELYNKLIPWDSSINFSLYRNDEVIQCTCGSTEFNRRGYYYTAVGKYQKYRCMKCGSETYSGINLFRKGTMPKGVKR